MFGGAFDPPHHAHVALAKMAIQALGLDELRVVPTGQAWHKTRCLSASKHRLAMTRLAFDGVPKVVIDSRELERIGPSFTIETLRDLQSENSDAQLHLIMGADQFAAFGQWHEWRAIVELAIICIAARADFDGASGSFDDYPTQKHRFLTIPMPAMNVSATHIRGLVAHGNTLDNDAPAALDAGVAKSVARYISHHRLYL
ncbi:MAG: nicotinate (nicotinamide) nucleotide adenylyltransferase [Polaromonas sp.]|nr:MAG: nicotinate (nicotinamide) nucleotide adenylyltransferase [Polaromonas sp.]